MSTKITEDCINCGACEPECPTHAIREAAEIYIIDPELCSECVGFYDELACAAVCPVDCCVLDEDHQDSADQLIERSRKANPDRDFGSDYPTHLSS